MTSIGERIRELRRNAGLTQEQLGEKLRVGKSTISQYEHDVNTPDPGVIGRLADIFGVTTDYLLGRTNQAQAPTGPPDAVDPRLEVFMRGWNKMTERDKRTLLRIAKSFIEEVDSEEQKDK